MKIPKKDGTTDKNSDSCRDWEDILCDLCGKSCKDSMGMNFEYAALSANWGYGSRKDGESHTAQICEPCYDTLSIKPDIKNYF